MNLSAIAIKRPVFTVMVAVALLVLGIVGYKRLGTDLFPDVSFPVASVTIVYPGASPAEIETQISKPIEDAVVSLNGIDRVRTFSREGVSTTVVIFKLDVDIQEAAQLVRERVAQARFKLPKDIEEPVISRLDTGAAPVLIYTLRGKRSLSQIRNFADDVIRPSLEQVDGVAAVNIRGGAEREVKVLLDRARIDALGVQPAQIVAAIKGANLTVPAGRYEQGTREISVRAMGELEAVDTLRDLVVSMARDGSSVRLRDVADVQDGFEDMRTRIRVNNEEAVAFEVVKQSGRNTVEICEGVRKKLATLEKTFPEDLKTSLIMDQSTFIQENAHEVQIAIWFGGAMAILIILIFMLDLRSTLISAVALPTSVVATFFLMYVLGFTLNMMTLLGLSLAIGLLIDDAVVVRENIFKHLERGEPPMEAALNGTKEIALSVLATTLTIVAVFVPVAFMGGIVGQFFRQFGLTVSGAVLVSLFVAFTLDPMLSSRFSKSLEHGAKDPFAWLKRPFEWVFRAMDDSYRDVLGWVVKHKLVVGLVAFGTLIGSGQLMALMGSDFVNPEDRGEMMVEIELPAGTSLDELATQSLEAEKKLLAHPQLRTLYVTLGPNGEVNKAHYRILTTKKHERAVPLDAIKDDVRAIAKAVPGANVVITEPEFVEGAGVQAPIMINVRGESYDDIRALADQVAGVLQTTAGVTDVQVKFSPGRPEMRVKVDRQRAADQGISVAQVAMTLRTAIEGEEASKLRQGKDEVPIRVQMREEDRASPAELSRLTLWSPRGAVALSDIARLEMGEGPQVIEREDRQRQIAVWATPRGRSLGEIVGELTPRIDALQKPKGTSLTYDGQIEQMNDTNSSMGTALLLAIIFIYLVLASQFESFIHPLTIMMTLPLALVGAILGLFLMDTSMAMGAMIGIILLMGLVTKNAILLVDRAIVRVRENNETPLQAILEAGPERLRPILMTSAAMVLGMLPTAISNGEGSEFRAPMAIAVIGGVVSSTLLSLVVIPALYLAIENAKAWLRARGIVKGDAEPAPAAE
ncbi:efflux RND transporter permease subunit [Polyangium jinanense]|uniref:Efflux RND transporter permease subunit n=1 Tax=Polyangium jinanense TaxID=2829994 RepID=A0A9X3XBB5_9BACT|nr:efflux RND transporter permease subunit [Polyangium jinanense]MDC3960779.1 efflux RND transporter permease subunit [Polyangium jinanense]MDC3985843.1 efflux RND transporter permease subunit [Polyangium jinanense]